jgi:hypothetical protein
VGFSGVLFAMAVDEATLSPFPTRSVFGLFEVPTRLYPWVLMLVLQFLLPGVSLLGHLCGILIGFAHAAGVLRFAIPSLETLRKLERSRPLQPLIRLGPYKLVPPSETLREESSLRAQIASAARWVAYIIKPLTDCIRGAALRVWSVLSPRLQWLLVPAGRVWAAAAAQVDRVRQAWIERGRQADRRRQALAFETASASTATAAAAAAAAPAPAMTSSRRPGTAHVPLPVSATAPPLPGAVSSSAAGGYAAYSDVDASAVDTFDAALDRVTKEAGGASSGTSGAQFAISLADEEDEGNAAASAEVPTKPAKGKGGDQTERRALLNPAAASNGVEGP